jgi:hypothetical protein
MQYTTGTIAVDIGSSTVTGTNTKWLTHASQGYVFKVAGEADIYEIVSVDSDTQLTIAAADGGGYAGSENQSGASYVVSKEYTPHFNFPVIGRGDVDWPAILAETIKRIDAALYQTPAGKTVHSITFEPSTPSPSPVIGMLYFDSADKIFSYWDGDGWRDLAWEAA